MKKYLIIDFDSTISKLEGLDELAKKSLECKENCKEIVDEIIKVTNLGMNGEIPFSESLQRRVKLIKATKDDVDEVAQMLKKRITDSVLENRDFFKDNIDDIYVISGGFKELIFPTTDELGVKRENILANSFIFDENNVIVDINRSNPMSQDDGKIKQTKALELEGEICVIGDGWTDYQIKESGMADKFIAFVENVFREKVVKKADLVAEDFNDVIKYFKSQETTS